MLLLVVLVYSGVALVVLKLALSMAIQWLGLYCRFQDSYGDGVGFVPVLSCRYNGGICF